MSGPEDGTYRIQLAVVPNPLIGVDDVPVIPKPVITEGANNVWNVKKLADGNYTLTLEEEAGGLLFIQDYDGKLVGSPVPPPSSWSIRGQEGGPYTIEVPSVIWPSRGWTVFNPVPRSPVTIGIIEIPLPNQKWNFIRLPDPE